MKYIYKMDSTNEQLIQLFMSKGLYFPFSRCKNTDFSANIKQYLEKT